MSPVADNQPPSPARRGPRRKKPVTFRLHATVVGTDPPLYRLMDVASDLLLSDLHEVLGWCFGWVDRAAHEFRCGPSFDDPSSERFASPEAVAVSSAARPEDRVRLNELFTTAGDNLFYLYDFSDYWMHDIVLEKILPLTKKTPRAFCQGGRRNCPTDGCGGVASYEYWSRRSSLFEEDEDEIDAFQYITPEAVITESVRLIPGPFVIEEINWALARQFDYGTGSE